MATIKKFKPLSPPDLKQGELATDGTSLFVINNKGKMEQFVNKRGILKLIREELSRR